jgi:hypothetical protein
MGGGGKKFISMESLTNEVLKAVMVDVSPCLQRTLQEVMFSHNFRSLVQLLGGARNPPTMVPIPLSPYSSTL